MQEATSMLGVGYATGYYGESENNYKRFREAAGQAFLTTPVIGGGGKVVSTTYNEISNRIAAFKDPDHAFNAAKQLKKEYEMAFDLGLISAKDKNDALDKIDSSISVVQNNKFKDFDLQTKINTIDNLVQIKDLEQQVNEIKSKKDIPGFPQGTLQDKIKLEDLNDQIKNLKSNNLKEIFKREFNNNGKRFGEWINSQGTGFFANKRMMFFENASDALTWFENNDVKISQEKLDKLLAGEVC
jgi:hypothetical protein